MSKRESRSTRIARVNEVLKAARESLMPFTRYTNPNYHDRSS
jgi:hypothetical protein